MKIFITGATGYIGQRLTSKLLEQGHEVHALLRQQPDFTTFDCKSFHFHQGDITDFTSVLKAMKDCDVVFHLAALAKVWSKNSSDFYDVNVAGTVNVLEAAVMCRVRKVVFTSSAAIYGSTQREPATEERSPQHKFFTDYECSKFFAEEKVQHYVRKGLNVVIVHPTKVFGPGIWTDSNAVSRIIKEYVEGQWHFIPGSGKMVANFSFIDDVVHGHILAMEKGRTGEKYILGGENLCFNEFFLKLKATSKKYFITFNIPYVAMQFYAWQEEMFAWLLSTEPKITRAWIRKFNNNLSLSSEKAKHELGYTITPFDNGLSQTLDWLKSKIHIYF
jgi:nucleoside-diphosphate-sugar epimerase